MEGQVCTNILLYGLWYSSSPAEMALSGRACLQVDEDTYLGMREDYMRMKRKSQEDHQKMRECVASPSILAQCMLRPPLFSKFP